MGHAYRNQRVHINTWKGITTAWTLRLMLHSDNPLLLTLKWSLSCTTQMLMGHFSHFGTLVLYALSSNPQCWSGSELRQPHLWMRLAIWIRPVPGEMIFYFYFTSFHLCWSPNKTFRDAQNTETRTLTGEIYWALRIIPDTFVALFTITNPVTNLMLD